MERIEAKLDALTERLDLQTDELIGMDEACQITGLKPRSMYQKTAAGEVPVHKRGKRNLFLRSELMAWATKQRAN